MKLELFHKDESEVATRMHQNETSDVCLQKENDSPMESQEILDSIVEKGYS